MDEKWKNIEDFPDYQISDHGRVYNTRKKVYPRNDKYGEFFTIVLSRKNLHDEKRIKRKVLVHRLVAKAFVDGYFHGAVVKFKDTIKTNLHYSNLEWVKRTPNQKKES